MHSEYETWLPMASGKRFCVSNPRVDQIDISDIAQGLSNECRFGGQVEFYSVAQHSVHVSQLLEEQGHSPLIQLHGLLHDSSEGMGLKDIPRSVKRLLGDVYARLESGVMAAVYEALRLPQPTDQEYELVKVADDALAVSEWRDLVAQHALKPGRVVWTRQITPWSPTAANVQFNHRYDLLRGKV